MLMRDIKTLSLSCKTAYVSIQSATEEQEIETSRSGKAVRLARPKHTGEFWCPASLLRRRDTGKCFAPEILVPAWFLIQEMIVY